MTDVIVAKHKSRQTQTCQECYMLYQPCRGTGQLDDVESPEAKRRQDADHMDWHASAVVVGHYGSRLFKGTSYRPCMQCHLL